ncbi:MAG: thioredoxin family protein, partial [Nanoarchaeota archaeon]
PSAKDATAAADKEEATTSAARQPEQPQQQQQTSRVKTETAAAAVPAKQIAENFYEFDQAAYEGVLKERKIVFLDFYANWCPICKAEEPAIKAAFNELNAADAGKVIGFRVNYNDDQTDSSEKSLAKKFGIAYQHTKVLITPDEKVLSRSLEQSNKQEILDQVRDAIAEAK